jgi:hypothetical protein
VLTELVPIILPLIQLMGTKKGKLAFSKLLSAAERLEWSADLVNVHNLPPGDNSFAIAFSLLLLKWIARGHAESVRLFVASYGVDPKLGW